MSNEANEPSTRQGADPPVRQPALDPGPALDLLADDDVRELFERADRWRTIPELASECDLPRSTAYRKVKRLVEAELLIPTTRPTGDTGKATEYRRAVDRINIEVGDDTTIEFLT